MDVHEGDQRRESMLLCERIDPIAREVLDREDPWGAYHAANRVSAALVDDLSWLPHGGGLYATWAELTDLYETGKTPIPDAHAALRRAATIWLGRPGPATEVFIEEWLERTSDAVKVLVARDGDFWRPPS